MRSFTTLGITTILVAGTMTGVMAQTQTLTTTATATINPNGPRTGTSGTNFFNVEGVNNAANATFGVADFTPAAVANAASISNLVLTLTESDAAFTLPGSFQVYLVSGNSAATSGLKYDSTQTATGGIGSQLGTLYALGTFQFTSTGNTNTGQVDNYTLSLANQSAKSLFLSDLSAGTIRLALGADVNSPATAATYFGSTGKLTAAPTQNVAPTLSFTTSPAAVPEASTTVSFGLLLALGGAFVARRKKVASN